jgi:putative ABC transport system ATP-binding protein
MVAATAKSRAEKPNVIRMSDVRFTWPGRDAFSLAVDAFSLPAAKRILLIGPSGSGKSTFLSLICGIVAPQVGEIDILGTDITKLPRVRPRRFPRRALWHHLQDLQPIALRHSHRPHLTRGPSAANLSVGQQQRVAAARALIGSPEIIVADEPTSALDRNRQTAFLDLLFTQVTEAGATLIMVSHDETLAGRFDEVMRLEAVAISGQRGRK